MNYFDFHCHLDTKELDGTREELLHELKKRKIGVCTIGVNLERSKVAVAMARNCEKVWCTVGQHPVDDTREEYKVGEYQKMIDENKEQIVAIGECGLDYYWPSQEVKHGTKTELQFVEEKKRQKLLFQKQITLSIVNNLPLMLHVRSSAGTQDAHEEVLEILAGYKTQGLPKVVFHFYTENANLAKRIIDAGYYISFPGVITFGKKVAELKEAVRSVPLDRIFAETDTPYATPVPYRGKTNSPLYVCEVYKKIAELRDEDEEKVREQILQNVRSFYGIPF